MVDGMQIQESPLPASLIGMPALACIHGRWRWRRSDGRYECISCKYITQYPGRVPFPRRRDTEDEAQYRDALRAYNRWYYQANIDAQREQKQEASARYREDNRDQVNADRRDYYWGHAEQEKAAARDRTQRRPKRMAKIRAKARNKLRLLDPEEFRRRNSTGGRQSHGDEQRAEYNFLRRLRRPYVRQLMLSILVVQYLAQYVWPAERDETRCRIQKTHAENLQLKEMRRADAKPITHDEVTAAIAEFEASGGTIMKIPDRSVEPSFHVYVRDG